MTGKKKMEKKYSKKSPFLKNHVVSKNSTMTNTIDESGLILLKG